MVTARFAKPVDDVNCKNSYGLLKKCLGDARS